MNGMLFGVPTCLNSLPAAQQDRLTAQLHLKAAIAQPPRHEETPWHPERLDAGNFLSFYCMRTLIPTNSVPVVPHEAVPEVSKK